MSEDNILDQLISKTDLPARALNCLKSRGLSFLGELVQLTERDLYKIKNLGRMTLMDIRIMLDSKGLSLGTEVDWSKPYHVEHSSQSDSQEDNYETLMGLDPEIMMSCRRLLVNGWSLDQLSKRFLDCEPKHLKSYIKGKMSVHSRILNRMVQDGLFLADEPLGQYICYLLDRLDRLFALSLNAEPSKLKDIKFSIAQHSAKLRSAINANESVRRNTATTWVYTERDDSFKHDLMRSLTHSFTRNKKSSWVAAKTNERRSSIDCFPQYEFSIIGYTSDLRLAHDFDGYKYNMPAVLRLGIINEQILDESDNQSILSGGEEDDP